MSLDPRSRLEDLATTVISRVRPATARTRAEQAPVGLLVRYALVKGMGPAVRGALRFPGRAARGTPVMVGRSTRILFGEQLHAGSGVFIGDFGFVSCLSTGGVHLGDGVTIRERAWIQLSSSPYHLGDRLEVGDETYIGPGAVLGAAARLTIGRRCQIGAGFMASAEEYDYSSGQTVFEQTVSRRGIRIGDDCWIGNGVRVVDGVAIGDRAVIGAGAVVTSEIPSGAVAVGVPARVVKLIGEST